MTLLVVFMWPPQHDVAHPAVVAVSGHLAVPRGRMVQKFSCRRARVVGCVSQAAHGILL